MALAGEEAPDASEGSSREGGDGAGEGAAEADPESTAPTLAEIEPGVAAAAAVAAVTDGAVYNETSQRVAKSYRAARSVSSADNRAREAGTRMSGL
jgi:hypothetical protein